MRYLDRIGARDSMVGPAAPVFPFIDRADGARWVLRLDAGRLPFWIFDAGARVPGTRLAGLSGAASAARRSGAPSQRRSAAAGPLVPSTAGAARHRGAEHAARRGARFAHAGRGGADPGRGWRRLPAPRAARGSLRELHRPRDRLACRACVPDTADAIRLPDRMALERAGDHVSVLNFSDGPVPLGPQGMPCIVLAVPAPVAADSAARTHLGAGCFRIDPQPALPGRGTGLGQRRPSSGVVGGVAEWVFHQARRRLGHHQRRQPAGRRDAGARWRPRSGPTCVPPVRACPRRCPLTGSSARSARLSPLPQRSKNAGQRWTARGLPTSRSRATGRRRGLPATIEGSIRSG